MKSTVTQRRSRHSTDIVPEFHAEAPQATVSEGLVQGPYVVARVGVELMTLRTKGVDSTNAPPTPLQVLFHAHPRSSQNLFDIIAVYTLNNKFTTGCHMARHLVI